MDVVEQVRTTISEHDLFQAGTPVVVGVSGGPDSLTLLHVLERLQDELQVQLHVGHLDHAIRPESVEDAEFVASLAEAWGLPATIERQDVPAQAVLRHRSRPSRRHWLAIRISQFRLPARSAMPMQCSS